VGWTGETGPVHLARKDLIAEEPVAKDATIAVGAVQALCASDIREITKERMHRVVLFADIVQVCTVLIDLVAANHALEKQERVEVLMLPAWRVIEDSNR